MTGIVSFEGGGNPSSWTNPPPLSCNPKNQEYCPTGYALHAMWSRAVLLKQQYGNHPVRHEKRAWETHLRECAK